MTSIAMLCAEFCVFFLGATIACPLCVIVAKIARRRFLSCRFSLFCVFASFVVVAFSVYAIFALKDFPPYFFLEKKTYLFYFFLSGFILCVFWKFLALPFLIFYCFFWWQSDQYFRAKFPLVHDFTFVDFSEQKESSKIFVCKVPSGFPFPIRRFWFSFEESTAETKVFPKFLLPFFEKISSDVFEDEIYLPSSRVFPARFRLDFEIGLDKYKITAEKTL